jgi:large subunit ribosomal protein L5
MQTTARLREHYKSTVIPALTKEFSYTNAMAVPKIVKVTVNMGLGEAIGNQKLLDACVGDLTTITGQKPVITKARKSIAQFKLREGMSIGCMVTSGATGCMSFSTVSSIPRFRGYGISAGCRRKAFDGRGNYTLGVRDQLIFPEIDYNKVERMKGMNVCITTTANTDAEARSLLREMGMPFTK